MNLPNFLGLVALLLTSVVCAPAASQPLAKPNIILILVDDLGFSDLSFYGSEINTPNLAKLAQRGMVFTNYHTAASCAPSRGMLLTGIDSHRNGVPNIVEAIPPAQRRHANYQGSLNHNVVTVATLLSDAGYHTYHAGKWHLGMRPDLLPISRGFERTVTMADTGADNWEQKPYLPIYEKANWFEDGKELDLPEEFYSSSYLVDRTIEFINSNRATGKPFFSYLPFLAVHIPVQAPKEFTERYLDTYANGWDAVRQARTASAIKLGIVPANTELFDMASTADWQALDEHSQRYNAKRMAVYAGMIEAMDLHIGRLVDYLKSQALYDNTLFIVTSDNGSEPSGGEEVTGALTRFGLDRIGYNNEFETLGEKGSFNAIGPSFASAAAAPLAFYKFYAGEGGMRVPLLIAGANVPPMTELSHAFIYVTDIAPTILEMAGIAPPKDRYGGRKIEMMNGQSLVPVLNGTTATVHLPENAIGYELGGNAALFQGDHKIVFNREWPGDGNWHLYNIATDPGETKDLQDLLPEKFANMRQRYDEYVASNGVLAVPTGYDQRRQVFINGVRDRYAIQVLWIVVWLLSLLPFYLFYRYCKSSS